MALVAWHGSDYPDKFWQSLPVGVRYRHRAPDRPGHAADAHYRDFAQVWLKGDYFRCSNSRAAVE